MKGVQAASLDAEIDRIVAHAECVELKAGNHAVLVARKPRNQGVESTRDGFAVYRPVNPSCVSHAARMSGPT